MAMNSEDLSGLVAKQSHERALAALLRREPVSHERIVAAKRPHASTGEWGDE